MKENMEKQSGSNDPSFADRVISLINDGWLDRREERLTEAREKLTEAASLCRQAGDQDRLVLALGKLGHVETDSGNEDAAIKVYEEGVALCREKDDGLALAHKIRHLGDIHRRAGRLDEAERCYDEALALYRNHSGPPTLDFANAVRPMAILQEEMGKDEEAKPLWREARDLYAAVDAPVGVAECSRRLARLDR